MMKRRAVSIGHFLREDSSLPPMPPSVLHAPLLSACLILKDSKRRGCGYRGNLGEEKGEVESCWLVRTDPGAVVFPGESGPEMTIHVLPPWLPFPRAGWAHERAGCRVWRPPRQDVEEPGPTVAV
jgi:hypothetical protein